MDEIITIPQAAVRYRVDEKRLRGAVWVNGLFDPIGDVALDLVQEDETLARWAAKQRVAERNRG